MSKTLRFVTVFAAMFVAAGVATVVYTQSARPAAAVKASAANPVNPTVGLHGLPVGRPVKGAVTTPHMTRDMLLSKGHADDIVAVQQLFYAYLFYHDTHDGPGVASLFTKDGVLETLYNNGGKTIEPNAGPNGKGCISFGQDQITQQFGRANSTPLPYPGYSHNSATDILVKVDGDYATLWARWATIRSNLEGIPTAIPGHTAITHHNGTYVSDARRTPEGWRFVHHRAIEDTKMKFGTPLCEENATK
jgi:hypothetical protein